TRCSSNPKVPSRAAKRGCSSARDCSSVIARCCAQASGTRWRQKRLSKARSSSVPSRSSKTVSIWLHCAGLKIGTLTASAIIVPMFTNLSPQQLADWLPAVIDIADVAGQEIMRIYRTAFNVTLKDAPSPERKSRVASPAISTVGVKTITPEIPLLGKEPPPQQFEHRRDWR